MTPSGNDRVVKRKIKDIETKVEPVKKALKKNEILSHYAALQQKYEALEKENRLLVEENRLLVDQGQKNMEVILLLEETVKLLEARASASKVEKTSVTVQTELIRCDECEFPAECMVDLVDHMHEFHPLGGYEPGIVCNHCGENLESKNSLMNHRKKFHSEMISPCINFSEGKCNYGELCWFSHDASKRIILPEFTCNLCDKKFKIKSQFMKHRKEENFKSVQNCRDDKSGNCQHGPYSCWFIHDGISENKNMAKENVIENSEIIKKLFEMMEVFTKRLVHIENIV